MLFAATEAEAGMPARGDAVIIALVGAVSSSNSVGVLEPEFHRRWLVHMALFCGHAYGALGGSFAKWSYLRRTTSYKTGEVAVDERLKVRKRSADHTDAALDVGPDDSIYSN